MPRRVVCQLGQVSLFGFADSSHLREVILSLLYSDSSCWRMSSTVSVANVQPRGGSLPGCTSDQADREELTVPARPRPAAGLTLSGHVRRLTASKDDLLDANCRQRGWIRHRATSRVWWSSARWLTLLYFAAVHLIQHDGAGSTPMPT
jgi:hypothetical protein